MRQEALDHFGYPPPHMELPACVEMLTEGEKAIIEDRRMWRDRAIEQEHENDHLAIRLADAEDAIHSRFKGCKTILDIFHLFDSMEGRALAAEETVSRLRQANLRRAMEEATGGVANVDEGEKCKHCGQPIIVEMAPGAENKASYLTNRIHLTAAMQDACGQVPEPAGSEDDHDATRWEGEGGRCQ